MLRRQQKDTARQIHLDLTGEGTAISQVTVAHWMARLGISRRRDIDPGGYTNRRVNKIVARYPGQMIHLDVKKLGRIPDEGDWRAHGRGSEQAKAVNRAKSKGARAGYVYLDSAIDGFSRMAYTEPLVNKTARGIIGFWSRARAFFRAHGIHRITRVVTDSGSNYRAKDFHRAVLGTPANINESSRTPQAQRTGRATNRIPAGGLLYAREWTS